MDDKLDYAWIAEVLSGFYLKESKSFQWSVGDIFFDDIVSLLQTHNPMNGVTEYEHHTTLYNAILASAVDGKFSERSILHFASSDDCLSA